MWSTAQENLKGLCWTRSSSPYTVHPQGTATTAKEDLFQAGETVPALDLQTGGLEMNLFS